MEDLRQRLLDDAGLQDKDFEFVLQEIEQQKASAAAAAAAAAASAASAANNHQHHDICHVKTLIWEARRQQQKQEQELSYQKQHHEGDEKLSQPGAEVLYFATALRYHDRVDETLLQEQLLALNLFSSSSWRNSSSSSSSSNSRSPSTTIQLKLTDIDTAETLTGMMSGTIPPFGHVHPLLLIVDETLISSVDCNNIRGNNNSNSNSNNRSDSTPIFNNRSLAEIHQEQENEPDIMLSTGSGSFQYSLWISAKNMLHCAKVLGKSVHIARISNRRAQNPKKKKEVPVHYLRRDITSTTTTTTSRSSNSAVNTNDKHDNSTAITATTASSYNFVPMSDEIKSLGQLLRDSALREGKAKVIRTIVRQAGNLFPELFRTGTELNFSRNAMHLAAWKSDLETIRLLVEAGKEHDVDIVNSISTGKGNYGKTPIFYAINQRRDDVVRLLVECGANLLIVNRNGNTPCGLASRGQLLPETCELLEKKKLEQLQSGRTFQNYNTDPKLNGHCSCIRSEQVIQEESKATINEDESDDSASSLKRLSKMLRDAAGKKNKMGIVRSVIEQAGEDFPKIVEVGSDGNFTKNAVHLAAWKGDLECIEILISAGRSYGLDLVNTISVGEGNYGKTPIFYAITQDRDDAVKLLMNQGANLLIINNKGQTPCSMAITHLQPETCQAMFEKEYEQIQSGGDFKNFRASNSDGKQYGDLDPRFEIDDVNYGEDIKDGMEKYKETLSNTSGRHRCLNEANAYKYLPADFLPRSLRPTTRRSRQSRAEEFRFKKSKCGSKIQSSKLPPSRIILADALGEETTPAEIVSTSGNGHGTATSDNDHAAQVTMQDIPQSLPQLRLKDLRTADEDGSAPPEVVLIDKAITISMLSNELGATLDKIRLSSAEIAGSDYDNQLICHSWGLDCEWKPSRDRGREYPVSVLQLSSFNQTFLLDLQILCRSGVTDPSTRMTDTETLINEVLLQLFGNPNIPILGFGIGGDITKLVVSFPHIPCFRIYHSVIDLDVLFRNCFPPSRHNDFRSLQRAVCYLLGKRLSKEQQCSNWQQRPLADAQVEYAALDAVLLPRLLKAAIASYEARHATFTRGFFSKHPHLLLSWRLGFLDHQHIEASLSHRTSYIIQNGAFRNLLSLWYFKQSWQTGKEGPALPEIVPLEQQKDQAETRENKEGQRLASKQKTKVQRKERRKKKPLKLSTVPVGAPPAAGHFLGYTKESCILELLSSHVLAALEDENYLGFNRRGGIIQMKNAWLLFVNFGGCEKLQKFSNKFSGGGRFMTFSIDPRKDLDSIFYDYVSVGYHGQDAPKMATPSKLLLLFARSNSGSQYLSCGECICVGEEACNGGIDLLLEVKSFEDLVGTEYMNMARLRSSETQSM